MRKRTLTTLEKELVKRQRQDRIHKVINMGNLDRLTWLVVQVAAIVILIVVVLAYWK